MKGITKVFFSNNAHLSPPPPLLLQAFRDVGNVNGIIYTQKVLGIPRISFDETSTTLGSISGLLAFDAYMLIIITIAFEVIGCILLHKSQKW